MRRVSEETNAAQFFLLSSMKGALLPSDLVRDTIAAL